MHPASQLWCLQLQLRHCLRLAVVVIEGGHGAAHGGAQYRQRRLVATRPERKALHLRSPHSSPGVSFTHWAGATCIVYATQTLMKKAATAMPEPHKCTPGSATSAAAAAARHDAGALPPSRTSLRRSALGPSGGPSTTSLVRRSSRFHTLRTQCFRW